MIGGGYYENIEQSEQPTQLLDETYDEFRERVANNNPYYY